MQLLRPQVGVGAIITDRKRILLAKRQGSHGAGTWGSVGGHLEFGETPRQTVIREAREELGITVHQLQFISCFNMIIEGKHYLDLGFTAQIQSGQPTIQLHEVGKIAEVRWFDLSDLPTPLFLPIEVYLEALKSGTVYFE